MNCLVEGVLRVPGDQKEAELILDSLILDDLQALRHCSDPHSASSALKLYFRSHELSLFGSDAWNFILNAVIDDDESIAQCVVVLLSKVPPTHKMIIRRVLDMLLEICKHQCLTKMGPSNLG